MDLHDGSTANVDLILVILQGAQMGFEFDKRTVGTEATEKKLQYFFSFCNFFHDLLKLLAGGDVSHANKANSTAVGIKSGLVKIRGCFTDIFVTWTPQDFWHANNIHSGFRGISQLLEQGLQSSTGDQTL